MQAAAPPPDFASVNPAAAYSTREVAALFRVTAETVARWIEQGTLAAIPRVGREHYRVMGSAILARRGGQPAAPAATPPQTGSRADRRRREAALADLRAIESM